MSASTNWGDVYHVQTARIAELERENAALLKDVCDLVHKNELLNADKKRLDWLIKNQIGAAYGAVSFQAFDKITRAAIDAAQKEA